MGNRGYCPVLHAGGGTELWLQPPTQGGQEEKQQAPARVTHAQPFWGLGCPLTLTPTYTCSVSFKLDAIFLMHDCY